MLKVVPRDSAVLSVPQLGPYDTGKFVQNQSTYLQFDSEVTKQFCQGTALIDAWHK